MDAAAVVTGGAGGLGEATVRRLVGSGWRVVVFDRSPARGRSLVDDLNDGPTRIGDGGTVDPPLAIAVAGDVCDDADVTAAVDAAASLAPVRLLVNVAGGGVGGGPTVRDDGAPHDRASFESTMRINAEGTFNAARLLAAAMAANEPDADGQRGVIVNTASIAGFEGQRGQVAYAAAKAAILGMTLPMARDLAPVGIRVCAIAPGPMATPVMLRVMDRLDEDPTADAVFPARMGRPDEFARAVEAVVANPYLNGENLRLDGALRLR